VPHVIFFIYFLPWGAKTSTVAKLRGLFCSFFLGGQNRNFEKVRGLKLQLSQIYFIGYVKIYFEISNFFPELCFVWYNTSIL